MGWTEADSSPFSCQFVVGIQVTSIVQSRIMCVCAVFDTRFCLVEETTTRVV